METIRVKATAGWVLREAVRAAAESRPSTRDPDPYEQQANGLHSLGYRIVGRDEGPDVVRVPCPLHEFHEMTAFDVARAFSALAYAYQDAETELDGDQRGPWVGDVDADHLRCPERALQMAGDVEAFHEAVTQDLQTAGLVMSDPEHGLVPTPYAGRNATL